MVIIENECVGCDLPCIHEACRYYAVKRYYCDECGDENVLRDTEFGELCESCLLNKFPIVEGSNY